MNTFSRIYRQNVWNGTETRSGPGSGTAATARVATDIAALVAELGVTSVLDVACGEGLWQPELPGYIGIDVAPEAVEAAQRNHPDRTYLVGDARHGVARADLVLCRDAIQHLPLRDGQAILAAIRASGSTWLLASTYPGGPNRNVPVGGYFEPDLEAPPYDLEAAARLYHDGYDYGRPGVLRDRRKMLGLWRLG